MATKRQIEEQDRATATRRNEACANIIDIVHHDELSIQSTTGQGLAVAVLSALVEAVVGDIEEAQTLRRKGWQSAVKRNEDAADVIRTWRDLLAGYAPAAGIAPSTTSGVDIAVSHRAHTTAELDQRLIDAFPDIGMPRRHIRTALEPVSLSEENRGDAFGALCGAKDGSWTHRGGANCETCIATYDAEHGPYTGPTAFNGGDPLPTDGEIHTGMFGGSPDELVDFMGPSTVTVTPLAERDLMQEAADAVRRIDRDLEVVAELQAAGDVAQFIADATPAVIEHFEGVGRRDGPVTPTVAREIREEIEADIPLVQQSIDEDPKYKVGDTVVVGGMTFVKHGDWPRETDGSPSPGTPADVAALNLNIVDPAGPRIRQRLSLAQVREHGLARRRGLEHRSVSQVEGHGDCGTRYALSDLEAPAWWNVGGKALHRCVEEINRFVADHRGDPAAFPSYDTEMLWLRHFSEEIGQQHTAAPDFPPSTWRAAKKGAEHFDWWRVEGPVMVERYVTWLRGMLTDGWEVARTVDGRPVVELEVYTDVGLPVPNLSIIDLALVHHARDLLLVVDIKAGGSAPKSTFQLGVYGWALGGVLGRPYPPERVRGLYYRARQGITHPELSDDRHAPGWPVLAMHPWADVVQRYRDMDAVERQGIYTPNVTAFCGGCGVRDLCPAQQDGSR